MTTREQLYSPTRCADSERLTRPLIQGHLSQTGVVRTTLSARSRRRERGSDRGSRRFTPSSTLTTATTRWRRRSRAARSRPGTATTAGSARRWATWSGSMDSRCCWTYTARTIGAHACEPPLRPACSALSLLRGPLSPATSALRLSPARRAPSHWPQILTLSPFRGSRHTIDEADHQIRRVVGRSSDLMFFRSEFVLAPLFC